MRYRSTIPVLAAAALSLLAGAAQAAAPPSQPAEGPGGVGDKAVSVVKRAVGTASASTFVFHASGPAPAEGRPVAVMLHAWGATNPQGYGGWIDHLVRNGWLVLFPRFQEFNRTRPADATANAVRLLKAAFAEIGADGEAKTGGKPDLKRVALIGHLAGVPLAANVAAAAASEDLPAPKLIYGAVPGGIARDAKSRGIALSDLADIPARTMMIMIVGDKDARAADLAARRILRDASAVGIERKLVLRALSDDHGFPSLTATLASPAGIDAAYDGGAIKVPADPKDVRPPPFKWTPDVTLTGEQTQLVAQINNASADALDYLAYWRTFDMAATAAFAGRDAASLKADPTFSDMKRWADGWPVKRLAVETPRLTPAPAKTAEPEAAPAKPAAQPAARSVAKPVRRDPAALPR